MTVKERERERGWKENACESLRERRKVGGNVASKERSGEHGKKNNNNNNNVFTEKINVEALKHSKLTPQSGGEWMYQHAPPRIKR